MLPRNSSLTRWAAIDMGSNTFILTIAQKSPSSGIEILCDEVRYVRLGEDLEKNKFFLPEALQRADRTLQEFRNLLDHWQVTQVHATATSAARDSKNGDALIRLAHNYNIPVTIISGKEEASLTFLGAHFFKTIEEPHWVIDIGGGSTEIIFGSQGQLLWSHSFDLGCVRLKNRWNRDVTTLEKELNQAWNLLPTSFKSYQALTLGVAGTPIELLRVFEGKAFSIHESEGKTLYLNQVNDITEVIKNKPPEVLEHEFGTPQGRADVLLHGALILKTFMNHVASPVLRISRTGIRYGLLKKHEPK